MSENIKTGVSKERGKNLWCVKKTIKLGCATDKKRALARIKKPVKEVVNEAIQKIFEEQGLSWPFWIKRLKQILAIKQKNRQIFDYPEKYYNAFGQRAKTLYQSDATPIEAAQEFLYGQDYEGEVPPPPQEPSEDENEMMGMMEEGDLSSVQDELDSAKWTSGGDVGSNLVKVDPLMGSEVHHTGKPESKEVALADIEKHKEEMAKRDLFKLFAKHLPRKQK